MTKTATAAVEYSGAYYRVIVEEDGHPLEEYTGGNHRLESQSYVGPDHPMAEDLATMKRYALSTAAEMAAAPRVLWNIDMGISPAGFIMYMIMKTAMTTISMIIMSTMTRPR